jgi:hypothetical protein
MITATHCYTPSNPDDAAVTHIVEDMAASAAAEAGSAIFSKCVLFLV